MTSIRAGGAAGPLAMRGSCPEIRCPSGMRMGIVLAGVGCISSHLLSYCSEQELVFKSNLEASINNVI